MILVATVDAFLPFPLFAQNREGDSRRRHAKPEDAMRGYLDVVDQGDAELAPPHVRSGLPGEGDACDMGVLSLPFSTDDGESAGAF
jgi:hypothetical protein